ncbi:MAG: hypothetical protein M3Q42_02130 [Pseudomonadota bacterium]|nr:hypothetical protein [Pseudomonadota bacterium]
MREVLEKAPNYRTLDPGERISLARSMVKVSTLAAELLAQEGDAEGEIQAQRPRQPQPLARAQGQPGFGAAADRVASTTRNVLNAVSFPRFVTDLVNGVFRAMLDSSQQQMQMYVQLLNSVSASAAGFEQSQFSLPQMRQWVADHFPDAVEYDLPELDPGEEPDPDEIADIRLRLKPGASMPGQDAIRATLGMDPTEAVDASNPEQLVPLARRYVARQRQQMLATMVMLGMNRIVIDSGRINASMRFHVDTRSAANQDRGSEFSMQNRIKAGASFGTGPWGASAEVESNIGYVSTERSQATEELNTGLELNSSVELNFRSDYLPLNQMAPASQAERIRNSSINPAAAPDPAVAQASRQQAQMQSERARAAGVNSALAGARAPMPASPPLQVPRPGTQPATTAPAPAAVPGATAPRATNAATPATAPAPVATAPRTSPPSSAVPPASPTPAPTAAPPAGAPATVPPVSAAPA